MREGGHDAGFAFDGDADRVLAVDRRGAVVDGDELIALAALHRSPELPAGVAVTVMTNFGFHTAMREAGIEVATTNVGDRYVLEALRERGWALGGEQSGHIIDMGFVPTGDGTAAALLALEGSRAKPRRPPRDGEAARRSSSTCRSPTATPTPAPPRSTRSSTPSTRRSRAAGACSSARAAPSRSCA